MKVLKHLGIIAVALFLCLGLPSLFYLDLGALGGDAVDAVSGASLALPDQPSGEFVVLINTRRHPATLDEWSDFFREQPVGVIMEDITCTSADGDAAGIQMAERCQARLAENQMKLRRENGLLVVSRAENGLFDVIILSKEMTDAFDYSAVLERDDVAVITVEGGAE